MREAMLADEEFHRVCAYGGGSGRRAGRREKIEERSWGKGREMGAVGERRDGVSENGDLRDSVQEM